MNNNIVVAIDNCVCSALCLFYCVFLIPWLFCNAVYSRNLMRKHCTLFYHFNLQAGYIFFTLNKAHKSFLQELTYAQIWYPNHLRLNDVKWKTWRTIWNYCWLRKTNNSKITLQCLNNSLLVVIAKKLYICDGRQTTPGSLKNSNTLGFNLGHEMPEKQRIKFLLHFAKKGIHHHTSIQTRIWCTC